MSVPVLDSSRQSLSQLDQASPCDSVPSPGASSAADDDTDKIHLEDRTDSEGGFRGWSTVLGAFLVQFCGAGYTNAFGVYQDYYTRIYITNQSVSAVAWIGSVNVFLVISSGIYAGILYDRGYFYQLLYGGSFLVSFSLFMLSFAKPDHFYQNFLAQAVGLGLGGGMLYIPSIAVPSLYFKKKQTLAMTFVASGSSLGALIHPIMLDNLFSSHLGYGGTTRVSAAMITFTLLIACTLMRPRLPPPIKPPPMTTLIQKFYKDWPYLIMCTGNLFFTVGFYFPLFYLQLDATKHGFNTDLAYNVLVMMNGSSLFGRLSPGFFAHSLGVTNMVVISSFCCTILIFAMIGLRNIPGFVAIAVLYGYCSGIFITLQAPLVSVLTTDVSELGARLGVALTVSALGALIGPPIHGSLLSSDFMWWRPAVVSGICALVGVSFFAVLPFINKKRKKYVPGPV